MLNDRYKTYFVDTSDPNSDAHLLLCYLFLLWLRACVKCAHHKGSVAMSRCRSALLDYNNMCIGMEDGILDDSSTGCHVRIRRSSNVLGEDLLH